MCCLGCLCGVCLVEVFGLGLVVVVLYFSGFGGLAWWCLRVRCGWIALRLFGL